MQLTITLGAALTMAMLAGLETTVATVQEQKVTITGCAVTGSGDGDGFLLANTTDQTATRILYWLDDDDDEVQKLMGSSSRSRVRSKGTSSVAKSKSSAKAA